MDMQQPGPNPLSAALAPEAWNVVFAGLNRVEHGIARPVFDSLIQQLRQQSMPQQAPPEDVERVIPGGA